MTAPHNPALPERRRRLARLALRHGTALGLDDDVAIVAERDARYLVRLHRGRCRALWRTDPSTDAGKVTP